MPSDFKQLRREAHDKVINDLKKRLLENSEPSEEELRLGAYYEMIEPQVRKAVVELNRKGYSTESSGFMRDKQAIEGGFKLDEQTKSQLARLEVSVIEKRTYTVIEFGPGDNDNLDTITGKWNRVVSAIPDQGRPAAPSESFGSELFRKNPFQEGLREIGTLEFQKFEEEYKNENPGD